MGATDSDLGDPGSDEIVLRRLDLDSPGDVAGAIAVCAEALNWQNPEFDRALFEWKHLANANGRSIIVGAEQDGRLVAVRPFMRWRFCEGDGTVVEAVRAVDTATLPEAQGRGLFRRATERALQIARDESVGFVFNTPNERSGPGYRSMGWVSSGPVPIAVRTTLRGVPALPGARTAADKASLPTDAGVGAGDALDLLAATPERSPRGQRWRTRWTTEMHRWRWVDGPIDYRVQPVDGGAVVFRLRRRGRARELVVAHVSGEPDAVSTRRAIGQLLRATGASHAIGAPGTPGLLSTSRIGPTLMTRTVTRSPVRLDLEVGDIELF